MTSAPLTFLSSLTLYKQPRIIGILLLGLISGLPLALTASTLTAWLAEEGVNIKTIGLFAAVGTPYAIKFLWSPLIDSLPLPLITRLLGRRRSWMIVTQLMLIISLVALGSIDPVANTALAALFALFVATCSATQDIVIDAYRVEMLQPEEQGGGAAAAVLGYRLGMIISTAGALYLATYTSWQMTYIIMAALVPLGSLVMFVMGEPSENLPPKAHTIGEWLRLSVIAPFREFASRDGWVMLLLFVVLYKLGDAFLGNMTNPFLLEIGFSKQEIANIVKLYGIAATIIGSFIGGALVYRYGIIKPLYLCGAFHAATNLMFVVQARIGHDLHFLAASITLENVTGGMSTAAFVAFISMLCNKHYTATQYALLSSLAAIGRTWLSTAAGVTVAWIGWEGFFICAALLAIPSLLILHRLRGRLDMQGA